MESVHEEWRSVEGYPGYEVSSEGRVRSGGRIRYLHARTGYLRLRVPGVKPKHLSVHRLVAAAFIGPSNGLHVNHKDCNRANNRVDNLEYVTPLGNSRHAVANGRYRRGEASPFASYTEDQIRLGHSLIVRGFRYVDAARQCGVTPIVLLKVCQGTSWKHLNLPQVEVKKDPRAQWRFDAEQVAEMRRDNARGVTKAELARRYGVSEATIYRIVKGLLYKATA